MGIRNWWKKNPRKDASTELYETLLDRAKLQEPLEAGDMAEMQRIFNETVDKISQAQAAYGTETSWEKIAKDRAHLERSRRSYMAEGFLVYPAVGDGAWPVEVGTYEGDASPHSVTVSLHEDFVGWLSPEEALVVAEQLTHAAGELKENGHG